MEKELFDADGNPVTAVPIDDVKAIQEQASAKDLRIAELEEEIQKGGSAREQRTEELQKLREAREEDSRQLKALQETVENTKKQEIDTAKKNSITKFAGANEELAKKLEEEYAIINIPEDTAENVSKRFEKAARMLGLYQEETRSNPAFNAFSGREPFMKGSQDENAGSSFLKTEKGAQLGSYLGIQEEK